MDELIPLLLLVILYLVPELLKRRKKPKEYEYPDIPEKIPPLPEPPAKAKVRTPPLTPAVHKYGIETAHAVSPKPALTMPAPVHIPHITEPASPWQGKLSPQIVQNGLIFAEILQPPRACRPLWRRPKK